jgi:hypothetical protein
MSLLFHGNGPTLFSIADGSPVASTIGFTTNPAFFNSANVPLAVGNPTLWSGVGPISSNSLVTPAFTFSGDLWAHVQIGFDGGGNYGSSADRAMFKFVDPSGVVRLVVSWWKPNDRGPNAVTKLWKLDSAGSATLLQTSAASASAGGLLVASLNEANIRISYGTSGRFRLWGPGGVVVLDYSGDLTTDGATALSRVAFSTIFNNDGNELSYLSEFLVTDGIDTRGAVVVRDPITGAGATNTCDSGTYASVNGATIADGSFLECVSAGESFRGATTPSIPTGTWAVLGHAQILRASSGAAGGPSRLAPVWRDAGGTDHPAANIAPTSFFDNYVVVRTVNPATSAPFVVGDFTGAQIGFDSVA